MRFRLLPNSPLGWTPFAWLIYLSFYIVVAIATSTTAADWMLHGTGLVVFLVLYFRAFWLSREGLLRMALVIAGLGVIFSPYNMGASAFFIYGAAFLGDAARPAVALRWLLGIVAVIALEAWIVPLDIRTWVPALVFSLLIGGTNIHFGELRRKDQALLAARKNAEHLAAVAERERIARDLHDLLGHTLSVIVIKSELAAKLADIDPARAANEIRDVERISRNALAEVRHAIHGYRGERVEQELATGRVALEAGGVTLVEDVPALQVEPAIERALALALREALTNVLRHARATRCDVRAERTGGSLRLIVQDDGVGGADREGAGLSGMRARLAEIGGTVLRDGTQGTRLELSVPLQRELHGRGRNVMIRVVIAEDQSMILGALAALLDIEPDLEVVGQAATGPEAVDLVMRVRPDILLTDIEMPGLTGLDVAAELRTRGSATRVIILTTFARSGYLRRALDVGASGYLLKDSPSAQLAEAIRRVAGGGRAIDPTLAAEAWTEPDPLTDRERQVLRLSDEGLSGELIARQLKLSEGTVRNYLSEAIGKLGAANRVEAARIARQRGWL